MKAGQKSEGKLLSLKEAVRLHVKPGMKLHLAGVPGAAICEIIRQFYGIKPEFKLIQSTITWHGISLTVFMRFPC